MSYVFYDFLKEYDERRPYNQRKKGAFTHDEIIGVLDGQQRLSSMYIGLMGTHTEKAPYKRWDNPDAFKPHSLYINVLSLPYTVNEKNAIEVVEDENFEFRFLDDQKIVDHVSRKIPGTNGDPDRYEPMAWYKVGDVLLWSEDPEISLIIDDLMDSCTTEEQRVAITEKKRLIRKCFGALYDRFHKDELINYFEVAKKDLEDILKIFVRVNSGGTVLSKTDLLFSTIVATWDDGRDQIEDLQKRINAKGDGFNFGNEYLMRCCLVLSDGPVIYKVDSFKAEIVEEIKQQWKVIASSIEKTVDLLVEFGLSGSTLSSQNATILIAYYIHKGGVLDDSTKSEIQKYLIHALLKLVYGGSQDQLITTLRKGFRKEFFGEGTGGNERISNPFTFERLLKIQLPQQKTFSVNDEDIELFLQAKKSSSSFWLLSMLYPQLKFNQISFHQDHIHPASRFNKAVFKEMNITDEDVVKWLERRDCVPNLQLMEGKLNSSKNDTPFKEWLELLPQVEQASFKQLNYIPDDISLEFSDFLEFYEARESMLRKKLRTLLSLSSVAQHRPQWTTANAELGEE